MQFVHINISVLLCVSIVVIGSPDDADVDSRADGGGGPVFIGHHVSSVVEGVHLMVASSAAQADEVSVLVFYHFEVEFGRWSSCWHKGH